MRECRTIWLVVAIATCFLFGPISGQGWTYDPIGQMYQADESSWEEHEETLDYRYISYRRNLETGNRFQDAASLVSNVQLAVDENREQLLVGGRDVLYRLHLDNLTLLERAEWPSSKEDADLCVNKGQLNETCHNYIRVLILLDNKDKVFICGTNAFSPKCTWRDVNHLWNVTGSTNGRGICPYSPDYNATSLMTSDGTMYTATVIDFSARDPAILRRAELQSYTYDTLRTMKGNSKWLSEPNFVSTYEIGNFVYFFFRENAVEYINCGKKVYSRVARVCKTDKGGAYSLANTWTSFQKARLNCSLPGTFPFYFDELQSTFYSYEEELVYAVFTTQPNSIAGSAVCVFNMTAFHAAFEGSFKHQDTPSSNWLREKNNYNKGKCARDGSGTKRSSTKSADAFMAAKKYQLMDQAVSPREIGPLIMRENERWTHIVVDHVLTKNQFYDVLFLATEDGKIRKMLRLPESQTTCLVEEIKIVENGGTSPVQGMSISPEKGAIYISTEGNILKIPVQRCYRFTTALMCLRAQDPYCGWDTLTQACTPAPDGNPMTASWEQDFGQCPILSYPVDGGWSVWSRWSVCRQVGLDRMVDHCLCRSRSCDRPRPANDGQECHGPSMEVSNCTVHGSWTEWSAWSACSQTCGYARKSRSRQCGNPPPKFGGNDCVGMAEDSESCGDNPECPLVPVDGKWSLWSGWSSCTRQCNSGIQTRKRACARPLPNRGGMWCDGNKEEWRMCNTHRCRELSRMSPWTEWVETNKTAGGYFKQRFRFTCRANVERAKDIKTTFAKSQAKFCFNGNGPGSQECYSRKQLANTITSIDTFSSVDKVLKKYCWKRKRFLKNRYCKCRTLGVFLVCRKCELG